MLWEIGIDIYTLLYIKKWITDKNPLCNTGNSAQSYVAARMGEEFRGEFIHVYGWVILLCTSNYRNIINQLYSNIK